MKIKSEKDALIVKRKFEELAERFGIKVFVDINHTQEPAGNGVGPTLEAIDVLKVLGQDASRPLELEKRSIRLAGILLDLCYKTQRIKKDGTKEAQTLLESGKALETFRKIIEAQYGDPNVTWKSLKTAEHQKKIFADKSGTIIRINNYHLNAVAKILGAPKDQKAGIEFLAKRSDYMSDKRPLMTFHSSSEQRLSEAIDTVKSFPIFIIQ